MYDKYTKLTYFGGRDYDTETVRWTTKDPIGLNGGLNVYAYVNSVNYIDPEGRYLVVVAGCIAGGPLGAAGCAGPGAGLGLAFSDGTANASIDSAISSLL